MSGVYDSAELARGYAFDRPAVHHRLLAASGVTGTARRALDVGCGAGVSTAALRPLAAQVIGVEPAAAMLAHREAVAPGASFAVARAEALPFPDSSFDPVTAAGALNYTDLARSLPQLRRVLTPAGRLVVYDFSEARNAAEGPALSDWFARFEQRFPWPPGWRPLDPRDLPGTEPGLRLLESRHQVVALPMTRQTYQRYALSEVNADWAVRADVRARGEARGWCEQTLADVFGAGELTVLFRGHVATFVRAS
ncbi:class I SAM-dependent methyltransferase [Catellatospora sichuanensis]|uniref:class I SAM-dependent methyltransferase n=1 Tax=Catellatospora sichuanensis TaxID=1969805 RepID=UPI001643373A|nr:class I SAM-dependent methyltransferase [Catellatospora sichuanensis]